MPKVNNGLGHAGHQGVRMTPLVGEWGLGGDTPWVGGGLHPLGRSQKYSVQILPLPASP